MIRRCAYILDRALRANAHISELSEAEKRAIVLGALHNYEMVALDSRGGSSHDATNQADQRDSPSISEEKVLRDAVRTFANHAMALGGILEGRSFPPHFDLSGVRISVPMSRIYMPSANMEACSVSHGSFAYSIMPNCTMSSGSFRDVQFTSCVLRKSIMNNCRFKNCDFTRCDLSDVEFKDSVFFHCNFRGCNFKGAIGNRQTSFIHPTGKESFRISIRGDPKIIWPPLIKAVPSTTPSV
uniref:Pentapeptide repeat-containing protein n=1 Tax=Paramoeba aestuarina TaxID=180227 RepID=A0A7S4KI64_9EUKA|mmetsp:Transcript_1940/g.2982  ORF Transcript_1940/g.2982 Transcript_1940/m.2982 type:complete len:241 (+) Transcript_1940:30-752(+)